MKQRIHKSRRTIPKKQSSSRHRATVAALIILLAGCASAPPVRPDLNLDEEQHSIEVEPTVEPSAAAEKDCRQGIETIQATYNDLADYEALTLALQQGLVPPIAWQQCAGHLLRKLPQSGKAIDFLDRMGQAYRSLLRDDFLESNKRLQAQLHALHQVYLGRPSGMAPRAEVARELLDDLTQALTKRRLGPFATRYGEDLRLEFALAQSRWRRQPLDAAVLDFLVSQKQETLLRRIVRRVKAPAVRDEARRRIVRLHIAASNWPEVTNHAAEVEALVLERKHFAVSLADHPLLRGKLDPEQTPVQVVQAVQDVWQQSITLLPARRTNDNKLSPLPSFDVRAALAFELRDLSHPVSFCAPNDELDVTPCLEPTEIHIVEPIARFDSDGQIRFSDKLTSATLIDWLRKQPEISLSFQVGGRTLPGLHWPISFELPESMDFSAKPGFPGPALDVRVEPLDAQRILLTVKDHGQPYLAVVERDEAAQFQIVSHGGEGKAGSRAKNSLDGTAGEGGAPGGNIEVQVVCATSECGGLPYLARQMVDSQGGLGGAGGMAGEELRTVNSGGGGGRGRGRRSSMQSHRGKKGARGDYGPAGHISVVIVKP